jgi:hypothetical protein
MKIKKNIAISDAGLIFNPLNGESFSVNPIGIDILNMLREEHSYDQISQHIISRYLVETTTFEKDFQDFTGFLKHYDLLEENEEKKA